MGLEEMVHPKPHSRVVFHYQDIFLHARGSLTVKVVSASFVDTSITPLCCSTIDLLTVRPSPVPSPTSFVVKKGSKILDNISSVMRLPVFVIETLHITLSQAVFKLTVPPSSVA